MSRKTHRANRRTDRQTQTHKAYRKERGRGALPILYMYSYPSPPLIGKNCSLSGEREREREREILDEHHWHFVVQ